MRMEECWTAPGSGILLGMHRDITPSGKAFFEFLRISAADDTVTYAWTRSDTPSRARDPKPEARKP